MEDDLLLDTNVFINALARRDPQELTDLLANLTDAYVSGPVFAELHWPKGRLDPGHPNTEGVLRRFDQVLARIGRDPGRRLRPLLKLESGSRVVFYD